MKLYKEVLIESADQAEALPDDAIVIGVETGERYTKIFDGEWCGVTEMGNRIGSDLDGGDIIAALVPIEAEEEWAVVHPDEPPAWSTTTREDARAAAERGVPTYIRHRTPWTPTSD